VVVVENVSMAELLRGMAELMSVAGVEELFLERHEE
jgi:hypothetical protein